MDQKKNVEIKLNYIQGANLKDIKTAWVINKHELQKKKLNKVNNLSKSN